MAVLDGERDGADGLARSSPGRAFRALARARWALAATAAVFALLVVLTDLNLPAGVAGFAAVAAVLLLAPQARDRARRAEVAQATLRMRRSLDARAAALIGALPEPTVVVDRRGNVVLHNPEARAAVAGLRAADPLAYSLRVPDVNEAVRAVLDGGQARVVAFEERVPVERWFRVTVAPIRLDATAPDAAPDYAVLTFHDETGQQRLERMRVDFVANASHELRTPLASVLGFIETLQGPARNDPAARERFLEIMRKQAVRMSGLIDDLLSLSRIELNAHVRPTAEVDLGAVVAQTLDALAPLAKENRVVFDFARPAAAMIVPGDRDELYRVCENLVENAIKYGAEGERVAVSLERRPPADGAPAAIALTVRDHGPGIPAEHIPRLTERFYRVDTALSREKGGTGLGLAIVKHIVARHRGRLAIECPAEGGAAFTVVLDAAPEPAAT